jgi:hypothetical protein
MGSLQPPVNLMFRRMTPRLPGAVLAAFFFGLSAFAQEKTDPAEDLAQGFRAYVVADPRFAADDVRHRVGKMQDLITDRGLDPFIAVFTRTIPKSPDDPLGAIIKKGDELNEKFKAKRLTSFVVFLALKDEFRRDEGRDALLTQINQYVAGAKPAKTTIGLSEATVIPAEGAAAAVPQQVSALGITAEDETVILVVDKLQIVKKWKFKAGTPPTAADLEDLAKTAEAVAGRK